MSSRLAFVRSLKLSKSLRLDSPAAKVLAGSLASFTSGLSGQQMDDVQNSTFLAQLAANKKFPDQKDTTEWYNFYSGVLSHLGWIMQDLAFDEYKSHQASFKLSEVTLELLSALIGDDEELLTVVKGTLDSFAKSREGLTLFKANSASERYGRFQVHPCTVTNGQVSFSSIFAYFEANQVSENYFFSTYNSEDITLNMAAQVLTLDEELYGNVRQAVIDSLEKNASKYVKNLPNIH